MRDEQSEYELMAEWGNRPHVKRWWDPDDPPITVESVRTEYRPDTQPDSPGVACIVELANEPIGFIQFYRWAQYGGEADLVGIPFDHATYGLDVFIAAPEQVDRGVGTRVVTLLSDYLIANKDASSVALTTDVLNARAIRCYEKSGFRKVKEVLDTDTYKGERVRAWLMIKDKASSD